MIETSKFIAQRSYLDLFAHLSRIISQTTNLSDLVLSSVQVIQSVLQVKNCSVLLLNAEGLALTMQASSVISEDIWKNIHIPLGEGIAGKVAQTGKAILVSQSRTRPPLSDQTLRYETDSYMCVPLLSGHAILGVVNVTDHVEKRLLTSVDLEMLEAIARLIGSAVSSHSLWERTRESREHLAKVLDGLPIGMFTIGGAGQITLCNKAARQYLNLSPAAPLDKPWRDYFPEPVRGNIVRILDEISSGRSSFSLEFEVPDADGKTRRSVRLSALEAEDIAPIEHNHVLFLIEDLQQMQELWELRRSDQMKSTFLSLISHELRTPLASIKGSIHLLDQLAPPEMRLRADRLFAILHRNSDRLARLVNNILDVMDLEADNLHLYRKRTDMHDLIGRISRKFENTEYDKKIDWNLKFEARQSELYVDESRFGQVVDHLIENAVKFSSDGGRIDITTSSEQGHWILRVANTGREIAPDLREKIFNRFYQVDGTLTRDSGGSGLGLYLCREIIRLHKGEITVEPGFTGGTSMRVCLPELTKLV